MIPSALACHRGVRVASHFAIVGAFAAALLLLPRRAEAFVNAGVDVGVFKRTADPPDNLKLGLGYGLHGEIDLLPLIKFGPYYLHYELSSDDRSLAGSGDAAFNTLGLRARLMLRFRSA